MNSKLFTLEIAARAWFRRALREPICAQPTDVFLCFVDHFEPKVGKPPLEKAHARMEDWVRRYPLVANRHRDADGRMPAHTFFYPWDEYDAHEFKRLRMLCAAGYGEIELHLHHRHDTQETLRVKLRAAVAEFQSRGALSNWPNGRPAWCFIHGNWALANSLGDGSHQCGVDNEIAVLMEEGCCADFTFPAWQMAAQPRRINRIVYTEPANRPKSYERNRIASADVSAMPGLPLIQGPLVPFIDTSGKRPRLAMDDADVAAYRRFSPARLTRWFNANVHVHGREDCVFIKIHTHGCDDRNRDILLDEDMEALFTDAEAKYNDGEHYRLHYVTAREMYNVVKACEAGVQVVNEALDFVLPPPHYARGRQCR